MASFGLTVTVTPAQVQLKPGGSTQVSVSITNVSDIVEHYQVGIVGLPSDDYWTSQPALTKLRPKESGTVTVKIKLPAKGGILGGRYVLGVYVTSPYQPDVARSADLVLEVTAVQGMTLTGTPMTAYGKRSASYALLLTNSGNIDVPVELVATDETGRATLQVTPASVYVRPGAAAAAQVTVTAPAAFTGPERRSTIAVAAKADGETRGEVKLALVQPPLIPPALFRALGLVLAIAVMASAVLIGNTAGKKNAQTSTNPTPTTATSSPAGGESEEDSAESTTDCPESQLPAENRLKPEALRALRCLHREFPDIRTYYGWREDRIPDHPSGQAIDIMIDSAVPDYRSAEGVALGNEVVAYLQAHKSDLRVDTIIWRQRSWRVTRANDQWKPMDDLGDDNANHFNHIHLLTLAAGESPRPGKATVGEESPPPKVHPSPSRSASPSASATPSPSATPSVVDEDGDGVVEPDDTCPDEAGPMSNAGCPEPAPDPVTQVVITSEPAGAEVELGIQTADLVVSEGTGRPVGQTPITVKLESQDIVDDSPQIQCCQLYISFKYADCTPTLATLAVAEDVVTKGEVMTIHRDLEC